MYVQKPLSFIYLFVFFLLLRLIDFSFPASHSLDTHVGDCPFFRFLIFDDFVCGFSVLMLRDLSYSLRSFFGLFGF